MIVTVSYGKILVVNYQITCEILGGFKDDLGLRIADRVLGIVDSREIFTSNPQSTENLALE